MSRATDTDFDPTTVPIRPAATVMMVRDAPDPGASGIEVFMLRRTGRATFAAGMYVFPGGRVDDVDHASDIAPFCRGLDDTDASSQLSIDGGGLAYWVASVRECFEEAGVLLAERRDGGELVLNDDDRHAVHDGELSMVDLCRRDDLVLDLSTTHYVDHWITPIGENRRFDTRFFLTEAPADQEGLHDDKETVESLWVSPTRALEMHASGDLMMLPPTIYNMKFLAEHDTASSVLAAGRARVDIPCILPKIRFVDGKMVGIVLPTEPDYADLPN